MMVHLHLLCQQFHGVVRKVASPIGDEPLRKPPPGCPSQHSLACRYRSRRFGWFELILEIPCMWHSYVHMTRTIVHPLDPLHKVRSFGTISQFPQRSEVFFFIAPDRMSVHTYVITLDRMFSGYHLNVPHFFPTSISYRNPYIYNLFHIDRVSYHVQLTGISSD